MDFNVVALQTVVDEINKIIKKAVVEMVTNINSDCDEVKYTRNSVQRLRVSDLRSLKKSLLFNIKSKITNVGNSGLTKKQAQDLGAQIKAIIDDSKDVLDNTPIKKAGNQKK